MRRRRTTTCDCSGSFPEIIWTQHNRPHSLLLNKFPGKLAATKSISLVMMGLSGLLLSGCGVAEMQLRLPQLQGPLFALVSSLLILLALLLVVLVAYAEWRWQFLQLIRPSRYLAKLPLVGNYVPQARGLQQGTKRQPTDQPHRRSSSSAEMSQIQQPFRTSSAKASPGWRSEMREHLPGDVGQLSGDGLSLDNGDETPRPETAVADVPTVPVMPIADVPTVPVAAFAFEAATKTIPAVTSRVGRLSVPAADAYTFSQFPPTIPPDIVGKRIGRYQIDAILAEETAVTTYQAFDLKLGRPVSLKIIQTQLITSPADQEKLLSDVRAVVALEHDGLAQVYDYDAEPENLFFISEYVTGPQIDVYLNHMKAKTQGISFNYIFTLMAQVAETLAFAHKRGVIHGGLTPAHVLLKNTGLNGFSANGRFTDKSSANGIGAPAAQIQVIDLGLSHLFSDLEAAPVTVLPYLSPEQCQGEVADARSDVYALGVIVYQLMTGQLPFTVDSIAEAVRQHTHAAPTVPTEIRPALPAAIEAIILKAMAKAPADRYQSADEMADELYQVASRLADYGDTRVTADQLATGLPWVRILTFGEAPRLVNLTKDILFIGNSYNSDILLPGKGVGERHAYIKCTSLGWQVVDLDSHNGTFLDGVRLLPKVSEFWENSRTIMIGPYTLSRHEANDPVVTGMTWDALGEDMDESLATADALAGSYSDGLLGITLLPPQLEVEPGTQGVVQISLTNQSIRLEHFQLQVEGLVPEWVTLSENDVQLMPGAVGHVLLTITPPAESSVSAGPYSYTLVATPVIEPEAVKRLTGHLRVKSFERLLVDMHPERLHNKGVCQLIIENRGNVPAEVAINGRDPADEVCFLDEPELLTLPSGEVETVDLLVKPVKRSIVGTAQMYPFNVSVTSAAGSEAIKGGQLDVQPYLPIWLLSVLGVLFIFLCILGAFLFNYLDERSQRLALLNQPTATPTATPAVSLPVVTPLPPSASVPASCADIKKQSLEAVDGEYVLYLSENEEWPVTIYCHNMAAAPTEYLTLVNVGETVNFSSIRYPEGTLTTHYTKVRIDLSTLTINPVDRAFAITTGSLPPFVEKIRDVDYGIAVGCHGGAPGSVWGKGNIDLTGLPFVIADTVEFVIEGGNAEGPGAEMMPDRKMVELTVSGRCGWVRPLAGLSLQYAP